ncbi:murein DD-endopeptidase [Onishia taeanensis]|uniref:Murein DD-endopeptidase n=1 Tax=Onishia taeanensis TaxID=284577 RepID=A0A1G7UBC7_9GAMM|nr:peptidoglycan DD-metalloendopeptidase family protein [Halomonas taeanensis]SDG44060.1 murein DD-endopeptidase [Halomonas taeanensis]
MLRILHSLPRTHKFLLLPVATMVAVLGAQQLYSTVSASDDETDNTEFTVVEMPIGNSDATQVVETASTPGQERPSLRSDNEGYIPLNTLKAQEIVDINFLAKAHAGTLDGSDARDLTSFDASPQVIEQGDSTTVDDTAGLVAGEPPTLDAGVLQLASHLTEINVDGGAEGGTSYDDFSADPLWLIDDDPSLEAEIVAHQNFVPQWETYTVQPGDTFAVLAERTLGLGYSEVMQLLDSMPDKNVLTRWRVGQNFDYKVDEDGQLMALRIMKNARTGYLIERAEDEQQAFEIADIEKAGEATQRLFSGTVSGSFGQSAQATGLNSAEVAELTNVLSKKLDFRRDTRRGDAFQVLVESDIIDGKSLDSRILAVRYQGARMDLTVVRNSDDNRFYTPDGHSLDPAFNRYPFDGHYRISSSFNLRRKHPITGRISPHYGTDFAMPSGSTVRAPADGRVVKSAYHRLAGNYLVVRHDNGYKTRYLHLSKRLVSEGERVTMGERIALSGNTGRSTGAHLHYEVIANGNRVDAMRVDLPENQSLSGPALAAFKREAEPMLARLENDGSTSAIAQASTRQSGDDS